MKWDTETKVALSSLVALALVVGFLVWRGGTSTVVYQVTAKEVVAEDNTTVPAPVDIAYRVPTGGGDDHLIHIRETGTWTSASFTFRKRDHVAVYGSVIDDEPMDRKLNTIVTCDVYVNGKLLRTNSDIGVICGADGKVP